MRKSFEARQLTSDIRHRFKGELWAQVTDRITQPNYIEVEIRFIDTLERKAYAYSKTFHKATTLGAIKEWVLTVIEGCGTLETLITPAPPKTVQIMEGGQYKTIV